MEFLLVHLDDLAVVSHDSVDLDLHIGRLGVDGCAATLLDELLELLGEGGVLGKDFVTILLLDIAPVLVCLPEMALYRETDTAVLAQDVDHVLVPHPHCRIRVMVVVEDVTDTFLPVAA